jgi:urease accessory protein
MIANLHIQTKLRDGITYLKGSYFTPPFKLADVREDKRDKTLQLMLMSSSPGILDGDEYHIKIELDEDCSLKLLTQSYQRLFTMKGSAFQNLQVGMAPGASFCYLPHPTVPHESADFTSKSKIHLSNHCTLLWGEILTCGRKQNGEIFQFSKYHNLTEIYLDNKLIIKENLLIKPAIINVNAIGQLEHYTHQASLIYLNETADTRTQRQTINELLSIQSGITYGITETPKNGLLVRILGHKGEQLRNCLIKIADIINQTPVPAYA